MGQDTDSESNLISAGMPSLVKSDKPDFVGKFAVEESARRGARERLVGFTLDGRSPAEGAVIMDGPSVVGRVTSARFSEQLGLVIGLAWVPPEQAEEGSIVSIRVGDKLAQATVTLAPFYDPAGDRVRS